MNLRTLLFGLFALCASPAAAQVTLDANGTAAHAFGGSPLVNNSLTVGSGSNRCLVAQVAFYVPNTPTSVGVTWNGTSMSQIATGIDGSNTVITYLFGLAAPASGNNTLSLSWSGGSTAAALNGISFTGCAQTSTFINSHTATGTGTSLTNSITNPSGNYAVDVAIAVAAAVASPTQTQGYIDSVSTFSGGSYTNSVNPTFGWSTSSSGNWVDTGTSISEVTVGGPPTMMLIGVGK